VFRVSAGAVCDADALTGVGSCGVRNVCAGLGLSVAATDGVGVVVSELCLSVCWVCRFDARSIIGASFVFGLAGKVTNGPSLTLRLLGGRPRSFPFAVVFVLGQALETAGPCLLRRPLRALEGVIADCGSASHASWGALIGVTAESGCGVEGVSFRHLSCCELVDMALLGANALAGVVRLDQGSPFAKSGCALIGTALDG
jgi:hypothetical protein